MLLLCAHPSKKKACLFSAQLAAKSERGCIKDTHKLPASIREELAALEAKPESEIDFSDILATMLQVDDRRDYGEARYRALGFLDGRLHALVFTETKRGIRVISFRKANTRERQRYETQTQS